MTPEGFVISLHELGFFDSGEARLMPGAGDKIKRIAEVLMQYGLDMRVEGHTDNVPIHNAMFASNWDLSTARAMAVAMMLLNESGVDPQAHIDCRLRPVSSIRQQRHSGRSQSEPSSGYCGRLHLRSRCSESF